MRRIFTHGSMFERAIERDDEVDLKMGELVPNISYKGSLIMQEPVRNIIR
jgi:hypothetical protein